LLKDSVTIKKQEDKDALILEEEKHSSFSRAQSCEAKFE
jgi:hypothetical protein